jgi:hypothetical protein
MSSYSTDNGRPTPISLEDHTDDGSEQSKGLWAKSVTIDDYVVVSGTAPGLGAYVVWNCTVETLDVSLSEPDVMPKSDRPTWLCTYRFPVTNR